MHSVTGRLQKCMCYTHAAVYLFSRVFSILLIVEAEGKCMCRQNVNLFYVLLKQLLLTEIGNLRGASTITAGSTMLLSVAVKLSTGVLLYRCSGSAILVGST